MSNEDKRKIFLKKTSNYTFAIMFFLIFSIFIIFAIRPSLAAVFSLQKEENDLKYLNTQYEKQITAVIAIQSQIEKARDQLPLLNQAVSDSPEMNKILQDLGELNYLNIQKINIGEISLIKTDNTALLKLKISVESNGSFEDALLLVNGLFNQRRLKTVQKINITKNSESSDSGHLKTNMEVEVYYL